MRVLLYDWKSQCQPDLQEALQNRENIQIFPFEEKWSSYDNDPVFEEKLAERFRQNKCQICLSFNYFPLISKVCQREGVVYVSWIYDSPHTTLYSQTISNDCNIVFTFDKVQRQELKLMGARAFHLPLAVNVKRLDVLRHRAPSEAYRSGISFVGSLYENNFYQRIAYLPPHLKGYIEGLCSAQRQLCGIDFFEDLLQEAQWEELQKYVKINLDSQYHISYKQMFCDMFLKKYISSQERKKALELLGEKWEVSLFTGSTWEIQGVTNKGIVDYRSQMPLVFANSCLNLNLTIRSIVSGIPLRCLDIMGAKGALFSNVQPELEEYFAEGEEWIGFRSQEEMLDKAAFYLEHLELLEQICNRGYEKVGKQYTYEIALDSMFRILKQELV